jgi:hypothetical protein
MIIPFIALVAVIAMIISYFMFNAKHKDKGNRRGA